jgi:hypothetical protein
VENEIKGSSMRLTRASCDMEENIIRRWTCDGFKNSQLLLGFSILNFKFFRGTVWYQKKMPLGTLMGNPPEDILEVIGNPRVNL